MRRPYSARTQAYTRKRAEANMITPIKILRMRGNPVTNSTTLVTTPAAPVTIYEGKALVHAARGAGFTSIGEIQVDTRSTSISIPMSAPVPQQDDLVIVTSSATDPDLNAAAFQIRDVDGGGFLAAVRTLSCVGYEESHWWEDV